jgi:hypothetical protein
MPAYRITEIDSRIIVGTEQESILICTSLEVARRVIADALAPATKLPTTKLPRRPAPESAPETSQANPASGSATR